jgi:hypothetical protein
MTETTPGTGERGIALPMAIFAVTLLTSMVTGALIITGQEKRASDSQAAAVDAAALAQTGLNAFMLERATTYGFSASPPAAYESTRVSLTGGYADVVLERIRAATAGSQAVYVIRSTGVVSANRLTGSPAATRRVAQYARWMVGSIQAKSGWTSLTGLQKNGSSGTLDGSDGCGDSTDIAGVAVPGTPGYTQSGGGGSVPTGNPGILDLGTPAEAAAALHLDWANIRTGSAITPGIVIPGDAWPSFSNANYWPTILVTGDFTLPGSGRGILVVTGNFVISGGVTWEGIIMVGGGMTSNGNNTVAGTTYSGLDVITGGTPPIGDIGNGTKTFQYNSCNVARALQGVAGLQTTPNAWLDNWPSW